MKFFQLSAVVLTSSLFFSACLKEGPNCPSCPRGTTGTRGNVIFFTKTSCEGGGAFSVVVDDTINVPVVLSSSVPDCSSTGVVPTSLKTGSHKWKATCNSQEEVVSGIINISANGCLVKEIK